VWSTGSAGVSVSLRVLQGELIHELTVKSADRNERLRLSPSRPGSAPAGPTALLSR
jgi:hypothetical protein